MKTRILICALGALACSATQAAESVSFLACPIARDTGPDTDLCFFAEHNGRRYSLQTPTDWGTAQLGHQVLVEGIVVVAPQVCGGIVLEGRVSVLPELDLSCQEIVPPDIQIPAVTAPMSDARRTLIAERVRRAERDPASSLEPLEAAPTSPPAVTIGTSTVYYPFESDRSSGPDTLLLVAIARFASTPSVRKVTIMGFRGASRLDDGNVLTERDTLAMQRAQKILTILTGLGVPRSRIEINAVPAITPPTGLADWKNRRIEVLLSP